MVAKKFYFLFVTIVMIAFFSLSCAILLEKENKIDQKKYVLKEIGNKVVLTENEKVILTYNEIVFDTLPLKDRADLENGISIKNPEEAEKFIENYDG